MGAKTESPAPVSGLGLIAQLLIVALTLIGSTSPVVSLAGIAETVPFPLVIHGYVEDLSSQPLNGSVVTVDIESSPGVIVGSLSTTTDVDGFYTITFSPNEWSYGDLARVTALYEGDYGSNFTYLEQQPLNLTLWTINVIYPLKIGETQINARVYADTSIAYTGVETRAFVDVTAGDVPIDYAEIVANVSIGNVTNVANLGNGTYKVDFGVPANATSGNVILSILAMAPGLLSGSAEAVFSIEPAFTLNLVKGWNLVCNPLLGTSYRASTLGLNMTDFVAGWNSATCAYDKGYIVGASPPPLDFGITDGCGYWVYANSNETILMLGTFVAGTQTIAITVPSGGGWAVIGLNSLKTTFKASDLPGMFTGGSITTVASFSPVTQSYKSYIVGGPPPTDFYLVPGQAYWVYCTSTGVLSYDP